MSKSFAELGVSSAVRGALSRRGISAPFPVQELVIEDVLAGRDVLVKSPTGSGKTLAFGIPLVERLQPGGAGPAALVVVPTRELASQIVDELAAVAHARGLSIAAVYGGVGISAQATRAAKADVLVATPGRLEDLLQRRAFTLDSITILVLDEADRMLDMGFRPAIDRIAAACRARTQTLFFSATLDGVAGEIAARYTRRAIAHEHGEEGHFDAGRIEHRFVEIRDDGRLQALVDELELARGRVLVFVRTKRGADRLVKRLKAGGQDAAAIHGNRSQRQREQALSRFQAKPVSTLVATDVAARGIDVKGVSHVINFDPPGDQDAYIHRVGRTGRAGHGGVAVTLVGSGERHEMRLLARRLGLSQGPDASADRSSGRPAAPPRGNRRASRRRRPAISGAR